MRKRRTKIATYLLTIGMVLGQTTGVGASVYAAEGSDTEAVSIVQEYPADTEDGSEGIELAEDASTATTLSLLATNAQDSTEEEATGSENVTDEEDTSASSDVSDESDVSDSTDEAISSDEEISSDDSDESDESDSSDDLKDPVKADAAENADTAEDTDSTEGSDDEAASDDTLTDDAAAAEDTAAGPLRAPAAVMANGWSQQEDGTWKYYEDGTAVTGWKQIKSKWYFFNTSGIMVTGWQTIGGVKYYFLMYDSPVGSMVTGWKQISGSWYFFKASGAMVTGWQTIAKEQYYFNSEGVMQTSQWIGDIYLRSDGTATDEVFSREYMGSSYYTKLKNTQSALDQEGETDIMQRTLRIAQSQEGYLNYATSGVNIETARSNGYLWTGSELRCDYRGTGNTEYIRWMQRYVKRDFEERQYDDMHWCAIFASWCLYQAGYYTGQDQEMKAWYYSTCADPRIENPKAIKTAFCCDQAQVWYTPLASRKIAAYASRNTYVHTEVDPYEIPYRPGGMIFFCWEGDGVYFDHVGFVVDYDEERHVLTYISGNCSGKVKTYDVYYDKPTGDGFNYAGTIMAYAEYYNGRECWAAEEDGICYHQNGKRLTGWQKIDGRQYYFNEAGVLQFGWFRTDGKWYYSNSAGILFNDGWKVIDGKLYYFNEKGVMLNGWHTIDGQQYCFAPAGYLYTDGWWKGYEFDDCGVYTGRGRYTWHRNNVGWWYGNASGYAKKETLWIDGKEYRFDGNGYWIDVDKTDTDGWVISDDKYYYILKDGTRAKGWKWINGYYYYFDPESGLMRSNGWWDSYKLEANGTWIYKYKARWRKNSKGWWYEDTSGWCPKDTTINIEGVAYSFDAEGYLIEQ